MLPAWILAVIVAITPLVLFAVVKGDAFRAVPTVLICLALGWAALVCSTNAFGQEFRQGTFPILLAQPVTRRRVWWTKVSISGFAAVTNAALVAAYSSSSASSAALRRPILNASRP